MGGIMHAKRVHILDCDLTEVSGHLTPKLSIKRNVILKDFAAVIDGMYAGAPAERVSN